MRNYIRFLTHSYSKVDQTDQESLIVHNDRALRTSLKQERFDDQSGDLSRHSFYQRTLRSAEQEPWNKLIWLILTLFLVLGGSYGAWTIARPKPTHLRNDVLTADGKSFPSGTLSWSQTFEPLPCGKSPIEAKAKDCQFDIISTAWLPTKCIDFDLISEFESVYPWEYFADPNGTQPLLEDYQALGSRGERIYTTNRWHMAHCLFMWKKLNRALVLGRATDSETVKQAHTDHCSATIMTAPRIIDEVGGYIEIIYPGC